MNVLIIANFTHNFDEGLIDGRFNFVAEMLAARGHKVELVTSDFDHDVKEYRKPPKQSSYKSIVTYLHEPCYSSNISLRRLWGHYRWGCNVAKYLSTRSKPDVIYCAVPSLTVGVKAAKYCKRNNIRFIIDIQDLWPEAFEMAVNNPLLKKIFILFKWYVNRIYKSADAIIAVSQSYCDIALAVNKKVNKGCPVYLGNNGEVYEESFAIPNSSKTEKLSLAYIGTLGYSYDIPCVLKALDIYRKKNNSLPVRFVVMGIGPLMDEFKGLAYELGVECEFTGRLPYYEMVSRLIKCDIAVNPIIKGSVASIINKVGDYALSGLPVINTQESPEYRSLIERYQCGINCSCGNSNEVAIAIEKLVSNIELRQEMSINAKRLGNAKFDRRNSYLDIINIIEC